jgi:DNA-binding response OmpR family regulator
MFFSSGDQRAFWGSTEDPLTNIVDVYVARLRKKLGAAGKAIETVRGIGYRLSSAGP